MQTEQSRVEVEVGMAGAAAELADGVREELALARRAAEAWAARQAWASGPSALPMFLRHVATTVPYYLQRPVDRHDLASFPLVSRAEIGADRASFLSAEVGDGAPLVVKTSGTSGWPLTVIFDLSAWFDLAHRTYRTVFDTLPELRGSTLPGRPAVVLVTNERCKTATTMVFVALDDSRFERRVLGRGGDADLALLDELRSQPVPVLTGKPSYLLDLAAADAAHGGGRIRPRAIVVSGENLFADARRTLEAWFRCRVYDAYVSSEGGLIALECPRGGGFHVRTDRVHLEVRDDDGSVSEEGEGELVLTNWSNWAMPFVRYRTGDYGTLRAVRCACGHQGATLVALAGREARRFTTPRGAVGPTSLDDVFAAEPIQRYELCQVSPPSDGARAHFRLRWVPASPDVAVSGVEGRLVASLRARLGDVDVDCAAVARIGKPGGKIRRYVVGDDAAVDPAPIHLVAVEPLASHGGAVHDVAVSPDGAETAVARAGGVVDVWHESGVRVRTLVARASARHLAFAPVGAVLAAGGDDGAVAMWTEDGSPAVSAFDVGGAVRAMTFLPDGRTLLLACEGETDARIVEWRSGEEIARLVWHDAPVTAVATSSDGEMVATGDARGAVKLWDLASGDDLPDLPGPPSPVHALAFAPDGKTLLVAHASGALRLHHLSTGWVLADRRTLGEPRAIAFAPGGRLVAVRDDAGVTLFDPTLHHALVTIPAGAGRAVAFTPEAAVLCVADGLDVTRFRVVSGPR